MILFLWRFFTYFRC